MKMQPIDSSMFTEIGYDPQTETLGVRYAKNGNLFHHSAVPYSTWIDLNAAESFGKAFHALVKKQYPGVAVAEAPPADLPPIEAYEGGR